MKSFKPVFFDGRTIDECWFNGLTSLVKYGREYVKTEGSAAGKAFRELDHVSGVIYSPINFSESGIILPLAPEVPSGCPAPTSEEEIYKYFHNYLMDGKCAPNEHYKYGTFIVGGKIRVPLTFVDFTGSGGSLSHVSCDVMVPNQLQNCIMHFTEMKDGKYNLHNNHCVIQVGYPESFLSYLGGYEEEIDRGTSPCLRLIDLKIIKEEDCYYVCAYVYFRAWNAWAWPVNLGGIALLQNYIAEMLAAQTELPFKVGPLSFFSKAFNCYCDMLDAIKIRIGSSAFEE